MTIKTAIKNAPNAALLSAVCLASSFLTQQAEARPELILYANGTSVRPYALFTGSDPATHLKGPNQTWVEALPVDGVVLSQPMSDYYNNMNVPTGFPLDFSAVYGTWLKPYVDNNFTKRNHSYFLVTLKDMGDPIVDDWSAILTNFATIGKAAKAAGLEGIFFDDELVDENQFFKYPGNLKQLAPGRIAPTDTKRGNAAYYKDLAKYQTAFRNRGKDVMNRLQLAYPGVKVIFAHGPTVSEAKTPRNIVYAVSETMTGYFFTGMLGAVRSGAQMIDGGELYGPRTPADFTYEFNWRQAGILGKGAFGFPVFNSSLISKATALTWATKVGFGNGIFDEPTCPAAQSSCSTPADKSIAMTPQIMKDTLVNALRTANSTVWYYSDESGTPSRNYATPTGAGETQPWIDAMRNAINLVP